MFKTQVPFQGGAAMKNVVIVLFMLVNFAYNPAPLPAQAVKESGRFGVALDEASFPQNSPDNLRKSLLKALNSDKIEYMLAHLADPSFIDKNVREVHEGDFAKQVAETREKLKKCLKLLRKICFAKRSCPQGFHYQYETRKQQMVHGK